MDYTQSLSFAFEDPHWVRKLLIGGFIMLLSLYAGLFFILGFLVVGYLLSLLRNILRGDDVLLPDWSDIGTILGDGILGVIISLIYFVLLGSVGAVYFYYVAASADLPEGIMVVAIVSGALALFVGLKLFIGMALIRFVRTNNLADAINIRLVLQDIRADFPSLLGIVLFTTVLHLLLFLAGMAIFSPFLNFWGFTVEVHLFGQYGRALVPDSMQRVGQSSLTSEVS